MATELAHVATQGSASEHEAWARRLERLDGRTWLALDDAARRHSHTATTGGGTPVSGARNWLGPTLDEPTGLVATVTSLHVDGRFRHRAVRVLAPGHSPLRAAALALRSLDHVAEIRQDAVTALLADLDVDSAGRALSVLLAGRRRYLSAEALAAVGQRLLATAGAEKIVGALGHCPDRHVRRWSYELGHRYGALRVETLLETLHGDDDQLLRATAAQWLAELAEPRVLVSLLAARSTDARLVALSRLPEEHLTPPALLPLLADRSSRVRETARWRAKRAGLDPLDWYRRQLAGDSSGPRRLAACLDGLAAAGMHADSETAAGYLAHPAPSVRAAAVSAFASLSDTSDVRRELPPLLVDASPRVAITAARALGRAGATATDAGAAWASDQAWSRRAAWQLSRAGGNWDRVEADLRAACDSDPALSGLGRAGVRNWLNGQAATTWAPLDNRQRQRMAALLTRAGMGDDEQRTVAFHARIEQSASPREDDESNGPPSRPGPSRWWRR
jgi:HEAT repeat protein